MKTTRRTAFVAALTALIVSLGGCSMGKPQVSASASDSKTLTVWSMNGDLSPEVLNEINSRFTKETGVQVKLEMHDWDGITTKVTTALTTSTPPDVIDVGNTQVSGYAANGGLLDLTSHKSDLEQGQTWVKGLEDSATYDGKLYGVPGLLAPFAVLYNKKIWADAGITTVPTTYDELEKDLDAIKAKHTDDSSFSAFYLCGQDWYSALQWVWNAGGNIATQSGSKWSGSLASDASVTGVSEWKAFQNKYSAPASRTLATDSPDQTQIFADGKAATIIAPSSSIGTAVNLKSQVTKDDIGSFAIPGKDGKPQPTFTSGSDWVIPAKTTKSDLALKWVKIAASPDIQENYVFPKQFLNPNTVEGNEEIMKSSAMTDSLKGYVDSAKAAVSTPMAAGWLKVEGNKVMENYFSSVASGSSTPQQAGDKTDSQLNELLNQ